MTATARHLCTAQIAVFALIGIGTIGSASAQQPTLNSSGLTPQQCYQKDSDCTQFCGAVSSPMRYECFSICDRMLDNCLETGDWTDSLSVDPGKGGTPDKRDRLSALLTRMLMVLSDTDKDGRLSPKEIEAVKSKVFVKENTTGDKKTQTAPKKP